MAEFMCTKVPDAEPLQLRLGFMPAAFGPQPGLRVSLACSGGPAVARALSSGRGPAPLASSQTKRPLPKRYISHSRARTPQCRCSAFASARLTASDRSSSDSTVTRPQTAPRCRRPIRLANLLKLGGSAQITDHVIVFEVPQSQAQ